MPSLVLRPGIAVRLKQQPDHVPSFIVVACQNNFAWIRQPHWPDHSQLRVSVMQLAMPSNSISAVSVRAFSNG